MKAIFRVSLATMLLTGILGFLIALLIHDLYDEKEYDGPVSS